MSKQFTLKVFGNFFKKGDVIKSATNESLLVVRVINPNKSKWRILWEATEWFRLAWVYISVFTFTFTILGLAIFGGNFHVTIHLERFFNLFK